MLSVFSKVIKQESDQNSNPKLSNCLATPLFFLRDFLYNTESNAFENVLAKNDHGPFCGNWSLLHSLCWFVLLIGLRKAVNTLPQSPSFYCSGLELTGREACVKFGSQGWSRSHYILKDFLWLDMVKRYVEVPGDGGKQGPAWPCSPLFPGQVFRQTSCWWAEAVAEFMLALDSLQWKLHRDHSSLGLSAGSPFMKGSAWRLRFPCSVQTLSPCWCFRWAGKDFLYDCPTASSRSSFPNSSHS